MNKLISVTLCAAAAGAVLAGANRLQPRWAADSGLDLWNFPEVQGLLERESRKSEEMDQAAPLLLRRIVERRRVTAEVRAGRLTLFEAAARFGKLNAGPGEYGIQQTVQSVYPGDSYEEKLCRQVIRHVELEAASESPGAAEAAVARLEAELEDHMLRHGRVCLPE